MSGIDSYTKLMLHCDGTDASTTFTDSALGKTVTANGNAQIDTAQSVFGSASGLFDGTGDYLSLASSADFGMGTSDFSVDFRVRMADTKEYNWFIGANDAGHFDIYARYNAAAHLLYVTLEGVEYTFAWTHAANTWYHIAVSRNGTNLRAFIDGTQIGTTKTSSDNIATTAIVLGAYYTLSAGSFLYGWLDEFRISKGIARWTANFTPPTVAYSRLSGSFLFNLT